MIKIGILLKKHEKLRNYDIRIIQGILNDSELELSLIIKDGREENQNPARKKISELFRSKNKLGKLFFYLQSKIERKLFPIINTTNREDVLSKIKQIPTLELKPRRKGFLDIFSKEDYKAVKTYDLDLILRHEFAIIRGPILKAAKYGIWSFHHGDNSINRGSPPGFWEILLKQKAVGVTLQQLTRTLDGGLVIDKAYFNRHYSYIKTYNSILAGSVSVLFKNLNNLKQGKYKTTKSLVYYNPLYKTPNFLSIIKYSFSFYSSLFRKVFRTINYKLFGTRYDCWTLFIGKGNYLNSSLFKLKPIFPPKHQFWADPFIIKHKDKHYIFFENYDYKTKKGKISCGEINDKNLENIQDVLDTDYHLSFPFVFEENGEIFLLPESNVNNRLELYKCQQFPSQWELHSTAFEGEKVIDANIYKDVNNQKWLFVNKQAELNAPSNSELFIYKINGPGISKLESHKLNPVLINSKVARNGGSVFKYENDIYRPSQANIDGVYGRALNINRINKLSIDEYEEETITTVYPNFKDGLISTHHLHQHDNIFVIDAAYKRL